MHLSERTDQYLARDIAKARRSRLYPKLFIPYWICMVVEKAMCSIGCNILWLCVKHSVRRRRPHATWMRYRSPSIGQYSNIQCSIVIVHRPLATVFSRTAALCRRSVTSSQKNHQVGFQIVATVTAVSVLRAARLSWCDRPAGER